jgi:ectoine hydroxylase-related dioxygenase (phytanoyl-CoA dioxygenase family)
MKQYGISSFHKIEKEIDYHIENVKRRGYTILEGQLSKKNCEKFSSKIENVYQKQKTSFGELNLRQINELDSARMLFSEDSDFLNLITDEEILKIVSSILGENFILQLQNGIINRPKKEHHQTSWHRDIPYQEYTLSNPIAINVFYCLTPFNENTGGTLILPYSQLFPKAPSASFFTENAIQPNLNTGDVIIFDSWLYHKAGNNSSNIIRYGVNNLFTSPILKQQIDIPKMLKGKHNNTPILNKILGYKFETPISVEDFRQRRLHK